MATSNPINGVPFGQEKTREDCLARAAWEYDQASRLRMARHPVGYTALVEGHERAARDYERAAAGRKRAHATKRDHAADLIASYGTWTSSYSNEDFDRAQGLANRLTALDREEGRPAPSVGYSKERYAQAKQVVEDANRYGEKQQSLRAAGRSHARKKKIDHREAKRRLEAAGIDFRRDSDELRMSEAQLVADTAREAGYRKRKDAPGSTARMYFQYLRRIK
jgi:hypothetical protein